MSDWQPISTAPKNGTPIQAEIPGHGSDNVIAYQFGFANEDGDDDDCGAWVFVADQEPPDDWTDGVCWQINEDGVASTKPTRWKPMTHRSLFDEAGI